MQINTRTEQNTLVVSVDGRLDTISAPEFQSKIEELIDQGAKGIVLDLAKLEYISSAGLRSVLYAAKKAQAAGGKFSCCALQSMVGKVFDIAGFTSLIPVFDSLEEALNR